VGDGRQAGGKPQVKKAAFESTKKKEIGVSDLTLLSKISNEAINDNLKLRFEHDEIYVSIIFRLGAFALLRACADWFFEW
jgi:myosin-1